MAALVETVTWAPSVYQIETTDPVVGGVPNEGTGAGMSNIPHQQLAKRTAYLKDQVDTKVIRTTGNQSATGIKTFDRVRLTPGPGQAEPPLEFTGIGGEVNGFYPVAAGVASIGGGLRLALNGLAKIDFGYDNVLRGTDVSTPMQIDPGMLKDLAMPGLKATAGWQRMPNGLIIQWGTQSVSATVAITFPIAFPNAAMWAMASGFYIDNSRVAAFNVNAISLTGLTINQTTVTGGPTGWRWFAIGH